MCSYKQLSESEIGFIPTDKKMVHVNIPIENILQTPLQFSENIKIQLQWYLLIYNQPNLSLSLCPVEMVQDAKRSVEESRRSPFWTGISEGLIEDLHVLHVVFLSLLQWLFGRPSHCLSFLIWGCFLKFEDRYGSYFIFLIWSKL